MPQTNPATLNFSATMTASGDFGILLNVGAFAIYFLFEVTIKVNGVTYYQEAEIGTYYA